MTYPPPPGQPGAEGWQGGNDPHHQTPSGAPHRQQPAGGTSGPAGAPSPFGPQPPQQPRPGLKKNTWIIGGIATAAVALLAVVTVLFATGTFDSETGTTTGEATESGDDGKKNDGTKKHEPGEYQKIGNLCEALDFDAVESSYGLATEPKNQERSSGPGSGATCAVAVGDYTSKDKGNVIVTTFVAADPDAAQANHRMMSDESLMKGCDSREDVEGAWEKGIVLTADDTSSGCMTGVGNTTGVFILDGNLAFQATIDLQGELSDGKESEVLLPLAEQVLKAAAV